MTEPIRPRGRLRSLDGLRGLAAVVVLLNHAFVVYPWLRDVHTSETPIEPAGSASWWLTHTPLHLIWTGNEAVYTFFILSGIVLTLPVLAHSASFSWRAYYPKRLLRLYLPVWASLLWAALLVAIVATAAPRPGSEWVAGKIDRMSSVHLLADIALISDGANINGPLWSLRWEVLFSLLLPLYVWFAVAVRGFLAAKVAVLLIVAWVGSAPLNGSGGNALFFMSMFALGTLAAVEWDTLVRAAARLSSSRRPSVVWGMTLALTLTLVCSYWFALALELPPLALNSAPVLGLIGAALLVFNAAFNPALKRLLERPLFRWLGRVSFSLYVTHAPLLEAITAFTTLEQRWLAIVIGVPLAFGVAYLFYLGIERPSQELARRVGDRIASRSSKKPIAAVEGDS